ncbi:flavodoxin family protein [Dyadobacter sp. CY261]|uniref:flavodoxin family protein n=1 Tax=Dyadobacter sp. CY261 TaxID=2907203 RepID=UPI001F40FE2D|nr:flavodoxin family protein [Dyadobacter sp. CY261]MCF0074245.1 flavodoxin family protein [Dyadobacter sp. CY261]
MKKVTIAIVYHSRSGHTERLARLLAQEMTTDRSLVHLVNVAQPDSYLDLLSSSDTIVFGCPTYFGNVSAEFKHFMERTGEFWYKQPWKDKLAAGFTLSSTINGDKLNTLESMMLFACQHSMNWISLGVLPRFLNNEQTEGQNRLASYIGLMEQCDNGERVINSQHPGDLLTAELFARRVVEVSIRYMGGQNEARG